jgi:hypothetical protein
MQEASFSKKVHKTPSQPIKAVIQLCGKHKLQSRPVGHKWETLPQNNQRKKGLE